MYDSSVTDPFLLRERLEAVRQICCSRRQERALLLLLLLLTVYCLLDADVIDHVISTASRQPVQKHNDDALAERIFN